jgi:hypothetical protein
LYNILEMRESEEEIEEMAPDALIKLSKNKFKKF